MTRIHHVNNTVINDHDVNETYEVITLHLADGKLVAYRADVDGEHVAFTPAKQAITEGLARRYREHRSTGD